MALQTSGVIDFGQLQSEFGGSNPIGINEYYRGGSYVPSTIGGPAGSWGSYISPTTTYRWQVLWSGSSLLSVQLKWNGTTVYSTTTQSNANLTQFSGVSGYDYGRGTLYSTSGGNKNDPFTTKLYKIRRRTTASSQTVNASIPTSGTISMNQFYGGRNT
tara:strand:+ start:148 stop:624 length:477 start_codon:yes stop_codon:yes gene_type:complete